MKELFKLWEESQQELYLHISEKGDIMHKITFWIIDIISIPSLKLYIKILCMMY